MRIYLAGLNYLHTLVDTIYGEKSEHNFITEKYPRKKESLYDERIKRHKPFILESFYYADKDTERLLPLYGDFLLDSGAFTFMMNSHTRLNWDEYLERYADFIVRNNVKKFFELDIDSIVGYEKVLQFRNKLEKLTNRPCIPVWHENRGKDEFIRMSQQYSYVSIGSGDTKKNERLPWFIKTAHENNAKIHGLGFTALTKLEKYHFDSVDSTSWTTGNRFGSVYKFDGRTVKNINKPAGTRIADARKLALNNFTEWLKFQEYAENHL